MISFVSVIFRALFLFYKQQNLFYIFYFILNALFHLMNKIIYLFIYLYFLFYFIVSFFMNSKIMDLIS